MKILLLHNEVLDPRDPAEQDVVVQARALEVALGGLGHQAWPVACSLDLRRLQAELERTRPDVVFNLVESLSGTDRLMPVPTLLLDAAGVPYTGASTLALLLANDKVEAKSRLRDAGLPTPPWWTARSGWQGDPGARAIVKAVSEHASRGLTDDSVAPVTAELPARVAAAAQRTGCPHFAEAYIEGREFNLSVLLHPAPAVLPPAEIDFSAFAPSKPRIVGYDAKWNEASFEYHHTPRTFDLPDRDRPLLEGLRALAVEACECFDLDGYARVDFRVDPAGQPWILEVNANPCLSPDAGFAAALARGGIDYAEAVGRIVDAALARDR